MHLLLVGLSHDQVEKFHQSIMFDQTLADLAENRGHPDRIVNDQSHKLAKEHVVLNLFHEHALGTHAIEHLQLHGKQQLLWRYAGTSTFDDSLVHVHEQTVHGNRCSVDHLANHTQGMARSYEIINPHLRNRLLVKMSATIKFFCFCDAGTCYGVVKCELSAAGFKAAF